MTDAEIEERRLSVSLMRGEDSGGGTAYRPGDIDVICRSLLAFPGLGGPYISPIKLGSKGCWQKLEVSRERHGDYWKPASILEELAKNGKTFAEWSRTVSFAK